MWLPALIGAAGSLIGGLMNRSATDKHNARAEVRDDNKVQRLVADSRAAGIHPLAALGSSIAGTSAMTVPNTAAGDAVAAGASQFAANMPTSRSALEDDLLRANIRVANAQEKQLLADATSRTLVAASRAGAVGGAMPTSTDVILPTPFGVPGLPVANPGLAQDSQDHFGDIVENIYGIGNWLHSMGNAARKFGRDEVRPVVIDSTRRIPKSGYARPNPYTRY